MYHGGRRSHRVHRCRTCGVEFVSRNRLFNHLRDEGHDDGKQPTTATMTHSENGGRWVLPPGMTRGKTFPPRVYEPSPYTLPVLEDGSVAPRERIDLFGDGRAFILCNVLSPAECDHYIAAATQIGMKSVQANGYERRVRMCDRVAASSGPLASLLFSRIAPFLAPFDLASPGARPKGIPVDRVRGMWQPHGLNEMFRICSYDPGGHFAPHLDGGHVRSTSDASMQTFMLYLNDGFGGGSTRFFDESQGAYRSPDPRKVIHTYVPRRGDALVFNSELMHDGEALQSGRKFIMRSEVMYKWHRTSAEDLLGRLFDALGEGGGCVVGVQETVAAVLEGRAETVLVSDGLASEGEVAWLCEQCNSSQAALVTVPAGALGGAGKQFLFGLEGVGALLRADAFTAAGVTGVDNAGTGDSGASDDDREWTWREGRW